MRGARGVFSVQFKVIYHPSMKLIHFSPVLSWVTSLTLTVDRGQSFVMN